MRLGGRVVLVGLGMAQATINTYDLVTRNVRLQGSLGGSRQELELVPGLIAEGSLTPVLEEVAFDSVPAALERLEHGAVTDGCTPVLIAEQRRRRTSHFGAVVVGPSTCQLRSVHGADSQVLVGSMDSRMGPRSQ